MTELHDLIARFAEIGETARRSAGSRGRRSIGSSVGRARWNC
jgi:hypothetical protein